MTAKAKGTGRTPKKAAATPRRLTAAPKNEWRAAFLADLAINCNVSEACRAAGIARSAAYEHHAKDPDFAAAWNDAVDQGVDCLELEARRRALHGTIRPVFHQGEECGVIREYSDTLTIFLLKAHRPKVYRENVSVEHSGPAGGPIPIREVIIERAAPGADE